MIRQSSIGGLARACLGAMTLEMFFRVPHLQFGVTEEMMQDRHVKIYAIEPYHNESWHVLQDA